MNVRVILKWLAVSLFAVVLPVQPPVASGQEPPAEEKIDRSEPVFTIVDAGAEPRTTLRYSPKVGQAQMVTMSVNQTIRQTIDGEPEPEEPSPPMQMSMRFQVRQVLADGNFDVVCDRLNVELHEIEGMDRAEYAAARMVARRMNGRSMALVVDPRGHVCSATLYNRDGSENKDAAELASVRSTLDQVCALLPHEPVGMGARWTVRSIDPEDGFTSVDVTEYRLVAVNGPRVTLDVVVTSSAEPQPMDIPELGDHKMMLESMKGGGNGRIEIHLDQLAPVIAEIAIHVDMELSMEIFGEAWNIDQTVSVTISCSSEAAPDDPPAIDG